MDDQPPYTSSQFHDAVQQQLVNAAIAALAETKLDWAQVAPFLDAGRAICRDDVRLNGRLAIQGQEYDGPDLVDAEEAYLALSVRDREDGIEWLSQSWWLSDIALAADDPHQVRTAIAAMERSIAKLRDWLAAREAQGEQDAQAAEETPPSLDK
jgi:hypothetical protein